jgi:hypothetical protein
MKQKRDYMTSKYGGGVLLEPIGPSNGPAKEKKTSGL